MKKLLYMAGLLLLAACGKDDEIVPANVHNCYITFQADGPTGEGTRFYRGGDHLVKYYKQENRNGMKGMDSNVVTYNATSKKVTGIETFIRGKKFESQVWNWEASKVTITTSDSTNHATDKIEATLDANGNATEVRVYEDISNKLELSYWSAYSFDGNNNIIEAKNYDNKDKLLSRHTFEYDDKLSPARTSPLYIGSVSKHNVIRKQTFNATGPAIKDEKFTYTYNDKKLPTEQKDKTNKILNYYDYECAAE